MKKNIILPLGLAIVAVIVWAAISLNKDTSPTVATSTPSTVIVMSFDDCSKAGYPIMESYPRQCKTPDGRTFVEEIKAPTPTYINATSGVISVELPTPGSVTGKEFQVRGTARGWYFEGSFPVEILDASGTRLVIAPAQAQGDWMTSNPVPFIAKIKIPTNYTGKATVVLMKDNPSALPENDASMSFPITIEY